MSNLFGNAWRSYLDWRIQRRAVFWVLRFDQRDERRITEAEQARFDDWFSADPRHQRAFRMCWVDHSYMEAVLQEEMSQERGAQKRSERRSFREVARLLVYGPVAAMVIGLLVVGLHLVRSDEIVYTTRAGESRHVTLPDGSELQLSTRTQVRWRRCATVRCVTLVTGEAYFKIRRDTTRAFVARVGVDDAVIRVTGTQFDVRRHQNEVDVTVAEGTVRVSGAGGYSPWTRTLHVNEQLSFNDTGLISDVHKTSASAATSWMERTLEIADSVPAVICRLAEYMDAPVTYDPRVADFRVQGRFDLTNVSRTLTNLETRVPIVVERIRDSYVVQLRTPPDHSSFTAVRCP